MCVLGYRARRTPGRRARVRRPDEAVVDDAARARAYRWVQAHVVQELGSRCRRPSR